MLLRLQMLRHEVRQELKKLKWKMEIKRLLNWKNQTYEYEYDCDCDYEHVNINLYFNNGQVEIVVLFVD
jgi:hypothetical protein